MSWELSLTLEYNLTISEIGLYQIPIITRINKCELVVKERDTKRSKKPAKKRGQAEEEIMEVDETLYPGQAIDESNEESRLLPEGDETEQVDETGEEFTFSSFKLRKGSLPKNISLEQLQWYCTPLRLETVTTLIQTTGMKRKQTLNLVETLHVILKHTMPTRGKQIPVGFGSGGVGFVIRLKFIDVEFSGCSSITYYNNGFWFER